MANALENLRTGSTVESVVTILETATEVKTIGDLARVTTPVGKYFYIINEEAKIAASPEKYQAKMSPKHGVLFIVPLKSKFKFNAADFD